MKRKNSFLAKAAIIAALYAVLTYISAAFGLAYNQAQFRISEVLAVLPLYSSAAIPGLTIGCAAGNMISSVNPLDILIGSFATFLASFITRKLRKFKVKGFPLLSFISPVMVNAVFIAGEIAFFASGKSRVYVFGLSALSVGLSEAAVVFIFGGVLYFVIKKNRRVKELISD